MSRSPASSSGPASAGWVGSPARDFTEKTLVEQRQLGPQMLQVGGVRTKGRGRLLAERVRERLGILRCSNRRGVRCPLDLAPQLPGCSVVGVELQGMVGALPGQVPLLQVVVAQTEVEERGGVHAVAFEGTLKEDQGSSTQPDGLEKHTQLEGQVKRLGEVKMGLPDAVDSFHQGTALGIGTTGPGQDTQPRQAETGAAGIPAGELEVARSCDNESVSRCSKSCRSKARKAAGPRPSRAVPKRRVVAGRSFVLPKR